MKMNNLAKTITCIAAFLPISGGIVAAQAKIDVEGIAKYVYPGNTPRLPQEFHLPSRR